MCLGRIGEMEKAKETYQLAEKYGKDGYSINEDNELYERYPYQVRWH